MLDRTTGFQEKFFNRSEKYSANFNYAMGKLLLHLAYEISDFSPRNFFLKCTRFQISHWDIQRFLASDFLSILKGFGKAFNLSEKCFKRKK